jgi:hypothetical protein
MLSVVGIDALINDSLVGSVIMWGAYLGGFLCGLFGYLYLRCELHGSVRTRSQLILCSHHSCIQL